jgi:hypothetical protein
VTLSLIDRCADALRCASIILTPWDELPQATKDGLRSHVRAVARALLSEPPSGDMMNAGIASLGSDDDRPAALKVSDILSAASRVRLAEIETIDGNP